MLSRVCCVLMASKSRKTVFSIICLLCLFFLLVLLYFSDLRQIFISSFLSSPPQADPDFHAFEHGADKICPLGGRDTTSVIFINSAPQNVLRRQTIRSTWGHPNVTNRFGIGVLFVIGQSNDPAIQALVDWEVQIYGDVAQGNFRDSYDTLTKKSLYGLSWVLSNCELSPFVIKTDDDVFVHTFALSRLLSSQSTEVHSLSCLVWNGMPVIRRPRTRWTIRKDQFNGTFYPEYCSGSAYIMPMPVARVLYNASFKVPEFPMEDVYITGFLAQFSGVPHKQIGSYYHFESRNEKDLVEGRVIFTHLKVGWEIPDTKVWEKIVEREKPKVMSRRNI